MSLKYSMIKIGHFNTMPGMAQAPKIDHPAAKGWLNICHAPSFAYRSRSIKNMRLPTRKKLSIAAAVFAAFGIVHASISDGTGAPVMK
jgi:hypothetical protein